MTARTITRHVEWVFDPDTHTDLASMCDTIYGFEVWLHGRQHIAASTRSHRHAERTLHRQLRRAIIRATLTKTAAALVGGIGLIGAGYGIGWLAGLAGHLLGRW